MGKYTCIKHVLYTCNTRVRGESRCRYLPPFDLVNDYTVKLHQDGGKLAEFRLLKGAVYLSKFL